MTTAPNQNNTVCVHLWFTGRVQGVGFRAFVAFIAGQAGVAGWVRNVSWNQVECLAEGKQERVEVFVEMVKAGPPSSRVDDVRVEWETPDGELSGFEIRSSR